jgi:hypothetical protein
MSESEPSLEAEPSGTTASSVTEDAPTTPPRSKAENENDTTPDSKNDGSNETATTPVRKNASEAIVREATELLPPTGTLTPIRSRPGTPARAESPLPITPIPSRADLTLVSSKSEDQEQDKPCAKWSDALRTATGAKFSPSKPLNKPGSLHGLGKTYRISISILLIMI